MLCISLLYSLPTTVHITVGSVVCQFAPLSSYNGLHNSEQCCDNWAHHKSYTTRQIQSSPSWHIARNSIPQDVAETQLHVGLTWNKVYSVANQWVDTTNYKSYILKNIPETSQKIHQITVSAWFPNTRDMTWLGTYSTKSPNSSKTIYELSTLLLR